MRPCPVLRPLQPAPRRTPVRASREEGPARVPSCSPRSSPVPPRLPSRLRLQPPGTWQSPTRLRRCFPRRSKPPRHQPATELPAPLRAPPLRLPPAASGRATEYPTVRSRACPALRPRPRCIRVRPDENSTSSRCPRHVRAPWHARPHAQRRPGKTPPPEPPSLPTVADESCSYAHFVDCCNARPKLISPLSIRTL